MNKLQRDAPRVTMTESHVLIYDVGHTVTKEHGTHCRRRKFCEIPASQRSQYGLVLFVTCLKIRRKASWNHVLLLQQL